MTVTMGESCWPEVTKKKWKNKDYIYYNSSRKCKKHNIVWSDSRIHPWNTPHFLPSLFRGEVGWESRGILCSKGITVLICGPTRYGSFLCQQRKGQLPLYWSQKAWSIRLRLTCAKAGWAALNHRRVALYCLVWGRFCGFVRSSCRTQVWVL